MVCGVVIRAVAGAAGVATEEGGVGATAYMVMPSPTAPPLPPPSLPSLPIVSASNERSG